MASTTSALSRYRPIVLTVGGAAAAYSLYLLWSTFHAEPSAGLHRSNAVHHRRNPRRRARSQRYDDPDNTNGFEASHTGPPYGVFVVEDADNHGHRHRFPLFPGRLPDVDWFRRVCHHEQWMAEELVEEAQRQFLDTYLEREVDPTTQLSTRQETERVYRRLIGWGLPRAQIMSAFSRHNRRLTGAPHTDGTHDINIPANDDETEAASWHEAESQAGGMAVNDQNGDGHALRRTLYYIAEDQARQKGIVHRGITCDGCSTTPIRGIRWRCTNCIDYDLCSDCEATNIHPKTHMFQKVKVPARYLGYTRNPMPVYFPGNPGYMPSIVPNAVRKSLEEQTQYEPEEVDGLWEQFTCLANVQWDEDPEKLGAAIDRRAFDKSFVPRYTAQIPAPNLVYDRVFAFFDNNGDGLIGFREFVLGMNFIRMSHYSRAKQRKIFECYDIDGDNYVTRKDFLRIFRAYYNILREKTRDMLMVAEEHLSVAGAMDTIESSQPLSSAFLGGPNFNRSRPNASLRKEFDRFGDPRPEDVVLENGQDAEERTELIADSGELRLVNNRGPLIGGDGPQEIPQVRQEAVRDRWRRREFYTDEEEGFTAPDVTQLAEVENPDGSENVASTADGQADVPNGIFFRPSHSRSSSRVRFADDLESDARSDISTSSRPVGERWGGYEIPHAEEDLGKDILYQVTQQGCNEMLDPIFKRKEDLAMEVQATKSERQSWRQKINEFVKDMEEKTGADFKNDPLVRSPEAEELMKVSLQFVSLVTGRSWKTYQALKSKGFIPNEDIDALDGFVEEVFQPFERDLRQAENNGISDDAYKNFISSARSLIAKAAKRISETKNDSGTTTDSQKREARLEVDLVDMQLDELFERSNLLTDGERGPERTRRSEEPERDDGETAGTSEERELRWLEMMMRARPSSPELDARTLEARRVEVRSRSQRNASPPGDPTLPQFRPNSVPSHPPRGNFLPMPNVSLPINTTAPPERPAAPEIIPPSRPVAQTPSDFRPDPTMPQFRPNSERDVHPPRISSLVPPPVPTTEESTPSINRQASPAPAPSHANEPTLFIPISETSASDTSSNTSSTHDESTSAEEDEDDDDEDNDDEDDDDDDDDDDVISVPMRPSDIRDLPEEFLSLVSTAIRDQRVRDAINSSSAAARAPNAYLAAAYARQRDHDGSPPDEQRLARLAMLEGAEGEIRRVGKGRVGFEEFAEMMQGPAGGALVFVEGWLELGSL